MWSFLRQLSEQYKIELQAGVRICFSQVALRCVSCKAEKDDAVCSPKLRKASHDFVLCVGVCVSLLSLARSGTSTGLVAHRALL